MKKIIQVVYCTVFILNFHDAAIAQLQIKNEIVINTTCKDSLAGSISFDVEGGTAPFYYQWSNGGSNNSSQKGLKKGIYQVTISDNSIPKQLLTKQFEINPPKPFKIRYSHRCDNHGTFRIILDSFENAQYPVKLKMIVYDTLPNITLTPYKNDFTFKTPKEHFLVGAYIKNKNISALQWVAEDANGCYDSIPNVYKKIKGQKYSKAFPDTRFRAWISSKFITFDTSSFLKGQSIKALIEITPTTDTIKTMDWYKNGQLYCKNCPEIKPICENATYKLVAEDMYGCHVEVQNYIICIDTIIKDSIKTPKPEVFAYLPSAFSPNDDGINDNFVAFSNGEVIKVLSMEVYDRWGGLLFQNSDFEPNVEAYGWNGKHRGTDVPQGNYTYTFRLLLKDGSEKTTKGEVMLIR
jgi:gliding motility-associated-like protein